jgi:hypothetical protein
MYQTDVVALFNTLTIPSFYDHAPNGTRLPFITIHINQPDNFTADDVVYVEKWDFRVDLYTAEKSPALEGQIKTLLNNNKIGWTRSEEYLSEEACYEIEFEFQTIGNEVVPDGTTSQDGEGNPSNLDGENG